MSSQYEMRVQRLRAGARLPVCATEGSAGFDLFVDLQESVTIRPAETVWLGTGVALELPHAQCVGLLFARSSLGSKYGIVPANGVGVIDSDYRGEVHVALRNQGQADYTVHSGDRVAQLVLVPVLTPEIKEVQALTSTARGDGGRGSTGR